MPTTIDPETLNEALDRNETYSHEDVCLLAGGINPTDTRTKYEMKAMLHRYGWRFSRGSYGDPQRGMRWRFDKRKLFNPHAHAADRGALSEQLDEAEATIEQLQRRVSELEHKLDEEVYNIGLRIDALDRSKRKG